MEENENDIIYDLGSAESAEEQRTQSSDERIMEAEHESDAELAPEGARQVAPDGAAVRMTALHDGDDGDNGDNAEGQLRKMVEEMGAETLLEIIRDNRNAAIRQILSEVEASRPRGLPSGNSIVKGCTSIFDLAALA